MMKGFLATLFAASMSLVGVNAVFATAPTIGNIPSVVRVGDADAADNPGGTDNNFFVFTNAFQFSTNVTPGTGSLAANLKWSFGEFDYLAGPAARADYEINGKQAVNIGDTAIAGDPNGANALNPGAKQLNGAANTAADFASFRNILFSPTSGTLPFPTPNPTESAKAANGKLLKFYVSDENGYVASKDVFVKTVDGATDGISVSNFYTGVVTDKLTSPQTGWITTGISVAEASASQTANDLRVNVTTSSSRYRIWGWRNDSLMSYQGVVGSTKYVRGKFFIYATPSAGAAAPVNNVPNFRAKVYAGRPDLSGAQDQTGIIDMTYAATGDTGPSQFYAFTNNPGQETAAGVDTQPSRSSTQPSMYRVELDPVDVPSLNNANAKIGASFETMATSNNASALMVISEVQLGTYPADADADGTRLFTYKAGDATNGASSKSITQNSFNVENDFTAGYRQKLYIAGFSDDDGTAKATVLADTGAGFGFDTSPVPTNRFGISVADLSAKTSTQQARLSVNKRYRARFHMTSSLPTSNTNTAVSRFATTRVRISHGTVAARLELAGPANPTAGTQTVLKETLPGVGTANPENVPAYVAGTAKGGWYTALYSSILSPWIHPERGGTGTNDALAASRMPALSAQPGPGNATVGSQRDMSLGVDGLKIPTTVIVGGTTINGFQPTNDATARIQEIFLQELPEIDDGNYNPTLP